MKIPLLDLTAQYATLRDEIRLAVDEVFASQRFILGAKVGRLEAEVARFCGCQHAIGVASGTDALLLSLKALGIGPGDGVITSPFTFFATAGAIVNVGAKPIFVDIDPVTYSIDPHSVGEFLQQRSPAPAHQAVSQSHTRIRAIIPVHLYGQMAPMAEILDWARRFGLSVVEDAAQAIGASQSGPSEAGMNGTWMAGTVGNTGTLSFFPSKNLGGAGDGGMILTNDDGLAKLIRILRVHGSNPKYIHPHVGINSRLDELQAAILLVKLRYVEQWNRSRIANATRYVETLKEAGLDSCCGPPQVSSGNRHVFHQFVVRTRQRDALRAYLTSSGVGTDVYYPVPLHLQECFRHLGYSVGDLPEAERAAGEVLALPIYPELTAEQIASVVGSMKSFFNQSTS